ncbi:MAG: hypothetical protein P4L59_18570, partial [Desulfosporosinus sp.]|nr:hypothetical protein [Desulfosporosinus sp.]
MKKPSKQPWKVLSTSALAAVLSLSMVVPVFAADGDIMDRTTHNPYLATTYRSNTAVCNSLIDSLINSLDTFTYEFGGKNYEYHAFSDRVTSLIDTGITAPQAKSQAASTMQEYTEPGSALSVQNVAAINGTVTVTMNSAPATAPVLADFAVTNAGVAVVPT